jgi:hypothetical protein
MTLTTCFLCLWNKAFTAWFKGEIWRLFRQDLLAFKVFMLIFFNSKKCSCVLKGHNLNSMMFTLLCPNFTCLFPLQIVYAWSLHNRVPHNRVPTLKGAHAWPSEWVLQWFLTLFSLAALQRPGEAFFNPFQVPMVKISSFRPPLLVSFIIYIAVLGRTGYTQFFVMGPEAFFACWYAWLVFHHSLLRF